MATAYSPLLRELIHALRALPGVGNKTAQRMAFHILERDRPGGQRLAQALRRAAESIARCTSCRMLTEDDLCPICRSSGRDASLLCVVESPADVLAIEETASYSGRYFVLMGQLSPLDGIGPEDLGLPQLQRQLQAGTVREVILATGATVEGEATAHVIADLATRCRVPASRIAHGVPVGGDLEYVDAGTLSRALRGRSPIVSPGRVADE